MAQQAGGQQEYILKRKKLSGFFFESALPNEYLVQIGQKTVRPVLGGRKLRLFRKFLRVPASVQTLNFVTDNANIDFQGIGIEGYASWRIDPSNPARSITTLDFFDENDPMARTNNELRTICVEAVRHVISNMTIDEAMKKKEDIAERLKAQLKEVEGQWGIVFDQVGIEKVRIMSNKLFEELQAQFRDRLRLDVERTRIATDQEIATEQSTMKEKTELKAIETDKKIELARTENKARQKEYEIEEARTISLKERSVREEEFRNEIAFKIEQENRTSEFEQLKKNLAITLQDIELKVLATQREIEDIGNAMQRGRLEVEKFKREIGQIFGPDALTSAFIATLPKLFEAITISNYSVIDSGGQGGISPVGKIIAEIAQVLRASGFTWPSAVKPGDDGAGPRE
ncbi:MAG TPA: SPFH domain-containing protein [Spirochaetota bacterium]|nr:SPFH domain-containing protein [Spirochaetota bacterium]HPI22076.1 SPFH domain-containing protein [Spirochaetota bacterium]HPU88334.1 SPFH domain-containing protein [Spirochaetota bacterium]